MIDNVYQPGYPVCRAGDSLADAAAQMRDQRVGALVMCADDKVIGILSEHDVLRAVADGVDLRVATVGGYATWGGHVADLRDDSAEVAHRMHDLDLRHLPATSDGRVVGIVSMRDLLAVEAWV